MHRKKVAYGQTRCTLHTSSCALRIDALPLLTCHAHRTAPHKTCLCHKQQTNEHEGRRGPRQPGPLPCSTPHDGRNFPPTNACLRACMQPSLSALPSRLERVLLSLFDCEYQLNSQGGKVKNPATARAVHTLTEII
jgi:hypothetical protein